MVVLCANSVADAEHMKRCGASCYRCLQMYN
jgi:hypothetical protein